MDSVVFTPRLKLTLVLEAEKGSTEFEWLHTLHSNERTTWWSIRGQSRAVADTERVVRGYLPTDEGEAKMYRVVYAVHKISELSEDPATSELPSVDRSESLTEFIGLINLISLDDGGLPLPQHLTLPAAAATTTLMTEVAYMFLPNAWGKGYATESLNAVFQSCKRARSFWTPFTKVYVRAIVNEENPPSLRVMQKTGMVEKGSYVWTGKPVYLAGKWQEQSDLHIFGKYLLE